MSFLLSGKNVQLSPFYDLLCTAVYGTPAFNQDHWPERATLAWPIIGVQRLVEITGPLLINAGQAMGIKPQTARSTIRKLIDNIRIEAPRLLDEVIQENGELAQSRPELRATFAGETRLLRSINAIVINEMTAQISKRETGVR